MGLVMIFAFVDQIIMVVFGGLLIGIYRACIDPLCYILYQVVRIIVRSFLATILLPYRLGKYLQKRSKSNIELEQKLIQQVYEARLKIHQGNVLEGKRDLAVLSACYGTKRILDILKEVETWFSDV